MGQESQQDKPNAQQGTAKRSSFLAAASAASSAASSAAATPRSQHDPDKFNPNGPACPSRRTQQHQANWCQ